MLTFAYMVAILDRYALSLLIEPIKASLSLTDLQVGVLLGPAFAICYVVFGLAAGWLTDRYNRPRLIAWGVLVWCGMTIACGLAVDYPTLLIARLGVGAGEAALAPAALSLIADYFPPHRRARATGLYMMGTFFGAAVTYIGGGMVVAWLGTFQAVELLGRQFLPWQATFILMGIFGTLAAFLCLTIMEPPRSLVSPAPVPGEGVRESKVRWAPYVCLFAGMGGVVLVGYTQLWSIAVFERNWGWSVDRIGSAQGILFLVCGIPAALGTAWLTDKARSRGDANAAIKTALWGVVILTPGYILYPIAPTAGWSVVLLGLALAGQAVSTAAGPVALMEITPPHLRGRAASLYWLNNNVVGLMFGPVLVGWQTDLYGGQGGLKWALAGTAALASAIAFSALVVGARLSKNRKALA